MGNRQSSHKGDRYRDEEETAGDWWSRWMWQSRKKLVEWRKLEEGGSWIDKKYAEKLIDDIVKHKVRFGEIEEINILLVGPVQSGKSSFINSVASIDKGRIAQPVKAEKGGKSVTKQPYKPNERLTNFAIYDTIGVEKDDLNGLNVKEFMSVVKGNVYPFYKFNPVSPIDEDSKKFNKTPSKKDKMHCVVFVVDANVIGQENIPNETRKKLKELQKALADEYGVKTIVLLTKIDVLSKMVEEDIAKTYHSANVNNAVRLAEELFGVTACFLFKIASKHFASEELLIRNDLGHWNRDIDPTGIAANGILCIGCLGKLHKLMTVKSKIV